MKIREGIQIGVAVACGKIAYDLVMSFYVTAIQRIDKQLEKGLEK